MNKENCALKLVDEIILYYDARSKKHQKMKLIIAFHIYESVYKLSQCGKICGTVADNRHRAWAHSRTRISRPWHSNRDS